MWFYVYNAENSGSVWHERSKLILGLSFLNGPVTKSSFHGGNISSFNHAMDFLSWILFRQFPSMKYFCDNVGCDLFYEKCSLENSVFIGHISYMQFRKCYGWCCTFLPCFWLMGHLSAWGKLFVLRNIMWNCIHYEWIVEPMVKSEVRDATALFHVNRIIFQDSILYLFPWMFYCGSGQRCFVIL
jgi:hypothetical protein